jgi:outer membrane lipoprotein-sorting protein
MMKRFFICIAALLASLAISFAQTPEEIIGRMDAEMAKADQMGMTMTMDLTIPILGKISSIIKSYGEKASTEVNYKDKKEYIWMDETTTWTYDPEKNEIEIDNRKPSDSKSNDDNAEMLKGITDGYDVTMTRETDSAWYFDCKKSKSNTKKDDPKKMSLIVAKGTYMPLDLTAKMKGVTVSIRNASIGVSEKEVTFDASKFPGATVNDKRK